MTIYARPLRGRRPERFGRLERAMLLCDDFQAAMVANTGMRRPEFKN